MSIFYIYDGLQVTVKCSESNGLSTNKNVKVIKLDNNEITIKLLPKDDHMFCHTVSDDYYVVKGKDFLPIPKTTLNSFEVTYSSKQPIIISGLGLVEGDIKKTENIAIAFRRSYCYTNNWYISDGITVTYKPNKSKTLQDKISKIYKYLTDCYNFFEIKREDKYVINMHEIEENSVGGNGDIYKGVYIYYGFIEDKKNYSMLSNHVIYHEIFHNFNPGFGLNRKGSECMWFSEGFTEYFYRYILYEPNKFKRTCKIYFDFYNVNPHKNLRNENIEFDNDENMRMLPYSRGFIYADYLKEKQGKIFIDKYKDLIKKMYTGQIKFNNDQIGNIFDYGSFKKYIINGQIFKKKNNKNGIDQDIIFDKLFR
jgi:hypothetical protein